MLDNTYLKLLRIPNIFTVPPDIILGYTVVITLVSFANLPSNHTLALPVLITSSILLYLGGLVNNDYFDAKIDSTERPNRPIPSGRVTKKNALIMLIGLFLSGFVLSAFVNVMSMLLAGLLIACIVSYNYKLKNGHFRSYLMGGIRGLNVLYGASFVLALPDLNQSNSFYSYISAAGLGSDLVLMLIFGCLSMFFHVFLLTYLSAKEVSREYFSTSWNYNIKNICFVYLIYIGVIGSLGSLFMEHSIQFLIFLSGYVIIVCLIFYKANKKRVQPEMSLSLQFLVKNMILLIIVLDSVFIAGLSGIILAFCTSLFIIPAIFLSRKISMT